MAHGGVRTAAREHGIRAVNDGQRRRPPLLPPAATLMAPRNGGPGFVVCEATSLAGLPVRFGARGGAARVLQHEVDHLHRRLIIDHHH